MTNVIPFPRTPALIVVNFQPRTDLGRYRAAMRYADVVLLCRRALSILTLGAASQDEMQDARQRLQMVAAASPWPQARLLAAGYLRAAGRPGPGDTA